MALSGSGGIMIFVCAGNVNIATLYAKRQGWKYNEWVYILRAEQLHRRAVSDVDEVHYTGLCYEHPHFNQIRSIVLALRLKQVGNFWDTMKAGPKTGKGAIS
jgi:hypothetical protein